MSISVRQLASTMFFSIIAVAALVGCTQSFAQDVAALGPLRDELIQTYHEDNVNVVIQNGQSLGISFINTHFNDLPTAAAKQAQAREIAQYVKDHYTRMDHIERIWVSFTVYKEYFLLVRYTNSLDTYFFETADLCPLQQSGREGGKRQGETKPLAR